MPPLPSRGKRQRCRRSPPRGKRQRCRRSPPGASVSDAAAPLPALLPRIYLVVVVAVDHVVGWGAAPAVQAIVDLWAGKPDQGPIGDHARPWTTARTPRNRPSSDPHERHDPQPSWLRAKTGISSVTEPNRRFGKSDGVFGAEWVTYVETERVDGEIVSCRATNYPTDLPKREFGSILLQWRDSTREGPLIVRSRPGRICGHVGGRRVESVALSGWMAVTRPVPRNVVCPPTCPTAPTAR